MSATVNIRRDVKDAFYRYKMPKIQSKIEGKGNGIKTVVSNMTEVAKALNRPPAYVTKFFGTELGSIVHCDDKTGRYIVNGAHDAEKLASLLDIFINKFVLCTACDNPETDLSVGKDGTITRACKACGHRSVVDMGHKIVAFIQKNPPKRKQESEDVKDGGMLDSGSNPQEDNAEGMVAPEGLDSFGSIVESKFAADDWADASELREAELAGLSAVVRGTLHIEDSVEAFGNWIQFTSPDVEIEQFIDDRLVSKDKAVAIAVQVLLDPGKDSTAISSAFNSRTSLFKRLTTSEKEQKAFLGGLERLLGLFRGDLLKFLPGLLQAAYTSDIISEGAIMQWYEHISKRYMDDKAVGKQVREVAKPFIEWLAAGSDDSESEESE